MLAEILLMAIDIKSAAPGHRVVLMKHSLLPQGPGFSVLSAIPSLELVLA